MKEELVLSRREFIANGAKITAGIYLGGSALSLFTLASCDKGPSKPPALPKTETKPIFVPENYTSLRFLTYPCPNDKDIKIQQGWYYTWLDEKGKPKEHGGIDFIKGEIDKADTWKPFDVLAAADGWVCSNPPDHEGNALFMTHLVKGNFLHTYYGHLKEMRTGIPQYDAKKEFLGGIPIRRGEKIGVAGASGVTDEYGQPAPTWIHLHFQVNLAGDIPFDPYDLRQQRDEYPDLKFTNGKMLGQNTLWKNGIIQQ